MSDKPKRRQKRAPKEQFDAPPLEKAEQKDIEHLIESALRDSSEEARMKMSIEQQKDAILGTMEEFMKTYTLIGFNLENQAIVISRASNALESEALTSLTRKVYAAHIKAHG